MKSPIKVLKSSRDFPSFMLHESNHVDKSYPHTEAMP